MKRFDDYRRDLAACKVAGEYNKTKRAGNQLPFFALLRLFLDDEKTMDDIALADGVSSKVMNRRYNTFFAAVIDPEHERSRAEFLRAKRQALRPRKSKERKRPASLNGVDHDSL